MEKLHREEHLAALFADRVDLDDVGVVKRRGDPGLVEEHPDEVLVMRELGQDSLEYDEALEAAHAFPAPEKNLRHPADSDAPQGNVVAHPRHVPCQSRLHDSSRVTAGRKTEQPDRSRLHRHTARWPRVDVTARHH